MDRKDILGYMELFRELGLLFLDEEIPVLLKQHLLKGFSDYSLGQLFTFYKLHSNLFYRNDPETKRVLEDVVKIRAAE